MEAGAQSEDARHEAIKQKAILKAAFGVFAQYGFRRTAMEDIARAAGVSRPALYLHFRNKEDIARSLVRFYFDDAEQELARALTADGPPGAVLAGAFRAMAGQIKAVLLDSPHGMDLLETGNTVAADIVAEGTRRKAVCLAGWLERERAAGRIAFDDDPEALARLMLGALEGVKAPPYAAYLADIDRLAALFGKALAA